MQVIKNKHSERKYTLSLNYHAKLGFHLADLGIIDPLLYLVYLACRLFSGTDSFIRHMDSA